MARYSAEMKESLVSKMCSPDGVSAYKLSQDTGISHGSLLNWKREFSGGDMPKGDRRPEDWSASERLEAVFASQNLSEESFGEFLRSKGLHSHHIDEWKVEITKAVAQQNKRGRPKLDPELVKAREENKLLKRDLNRKNKALAEQTALVMLQKKVQEIWGEQEVDE